MPMPAVAGISLRGYYERNSLLKILQSMCASPDMRDSSDSSWSGLIPLCDKEGVVQYPGLWDILAARYRTPSIISADRHCKVSFLGKSRKAFQQRLASHEICVSSSLVEDPPRNHLGDRDH